MSAGSEETLNHLPLCIMTGAKRSPYLKAKDGGGVIGFCKNRRINYQQTMCYLYARKLWVNGVFALIDEHPPINRRARMQCKSHYTRSQRNKLTKLVINYYY